MNPPSAPATGAAKTRIKNQKPIFLGSVVFGTSWPISTSPPKNTTAQTPPHMAPISNAQLADGAHKRATYKPSAIATTPVMMAPIISTIRNAPLFRSIPSRHTLVETHPTGNEQQRMTDDTTWLTAADLSRRYARAELSPVEVAKATLYRAEGLQPHLNAFVLLDREGALAAARASEARWKKGEPRSPLDGIPTTIKDTTPV